MSIFKRRGSRRHIQEYVSPNDYCVRCGANIELQKGYSPELPYWICKGCGMLLTNPAIEGNAIWRCDGCEDCLNVQQGFSEEYDTWQCAQCGYINKIKGSEIFLSVEEYEKSLADPYKGLSDEDALSLSLFSEEGSFKNRDDILIVRGLIDNKLYVKKVLGSYDESVYRYLEKNPIKNMPKIYGVYKSDNSLIVIEEYIEGNTLEELLNDAPIKTDKAIEIAKSICKIIKALHTLDKPIIHRDIKPSNVIITPREETYLLDMNIAKWYNPDEKSDTRMLGTMNYAAPEQAGFSFFASNDRTDVYALGVLLNVMVTGKLPKVEKAIGEVWNVIDRCIKLEPTERWTDDELLEALEGVKG